MKLAGLREKAGGAHIGDKNLCVGAGLAGVAAGNLGEGAGDLYCNSWHDVFLSGLWPVVMIA